MDQPNKFLIIREKKFEQAQNGQQFRAWVYQYLA